MIRTLTGISLINRRRVLLHAVMTRERDAHLVRDDIELAAVGSDIAEASEEIEGALDHVPIAVGGEQESRAKTTTMTARSALRARQPRLCGTSAGFV